MKFYFSVINIFINLLVIICLSSNPIFANDKIERDSTPLKMQMLKYGLFVHYVPGLTTYKNGILCKNIDSLTENFNENKFAQDLSEMKVQYIIFTAWHSKMIPLYPSKIMNYWRPGYNGSGRDLIGDMIKAVTKKGIKVFLYTTPRDGQEFSNSDKEQTGWGTGNNKINGWDPLWDNFNYLKWNDFINDAYAELVERYGNKIEGLFLDEASPNGDSYRVIDYPKLVKTIKKNHPHLILIQNNYGNNYGLDILDKEYNLWGEFKNTNGNYWPAYTIPVATVISSSWWANTAEGKNVIKFSASDLARYIVLESAVNTEGGGIQLAAGPYADGGWETGVKDTFIKVGKLLESIKHSIFNTTPSKIFPTTSGLAIKDLNWGCTTSSLNNYFEYLIFLNLSRVIKYF